MAFDLIVIKRLTRCIVVLVSLSCFKLFAACSYTSEQISWGSDRLDPPDGIKYVSSYCFFNSFETNDADPSIIDKNKIVTINQPISFDEQFHYKSDVERNNAPFTKQYLNHQFGSVNNAHSVDSSYPFHTGIDLFESGLNGTKKDIHSAFAGTIVWAGKHSNNSGYAVGVYSRLTYPIKIKPYHWEYKRGASQNIYTFNKAAVPVKEFMVYYLHLDRCTKDGKKLNGSFTNINVSSDEIIGLTYDESNNYGEYGRYYTCDADPNAQDKSSSLLLFSPHLHLEILLPQLDPNNHANKTFLNPDGYDNNSEFDARTNSKYVDPEALFSAIKRRNQLLSNLVRAEFSCGEDLDCVRSNVSDEHMAMAQHFLGHDRTLFENFANTNNSGTPNQRCLELEGVCPYTFYNFIKDNKTKSFIIAENLNVVDVQLAPHWDIIKDGLPLAPASAESGVIRQQFQNATTSLTDSTLDRINKVNKMVTPNISVPEKTSNFKFNGIDYWVTNDADNKLYFELGEYDKDFKSIAEIGLAIPYETVRIHVGGDQILPATQKVRIALYKKDIGALDDAYTVVGGVTFSCSAGQVCGFIQANTTANEIILDQLKTSTVDDVTLTMSAPFVKNQTYAIGFSVTKSSKTDGASASVMRITSIQSATSILLDDTPFSWVHRFLCSININICNAQ